LVAFSPSLLQSSDLLEAGSISLWTHCTTEP
jgi:hypothetical protein